MKTFFEKVTVRPFPVSRRVAARSSSRRRWRPEALIKARAVSRVRGLPEVASSSAASTGVVSGPGAGRWASIPSWPRAALAQSVIQPPKGSWFTVDEDWNRLRFVIIHGTAEIALAGSEHA